jgi:hypothetical protein
MKRIVRTSAFLFAILLAFGVNMSAQTTRIQFARGKSSATVSGRTGTYGVTYVVRARSGQKLILTLSPEANLGIKVETAGRNGQVVVLREEKGGTYEVGLEESGDYTIFIGSTNNRSVPFTLTVKIGRLADI